MRKLYLILFVVLLLAGCKIDETYASGYSAPRATAPATATITPGSLPTARIVTANPEIYPTVSQSDVPALGYFVPVLPVAVFDTVAMQNTIDMLVPGQQYPFSSELVMSGKITFLCVKWTVEESDTSFGWNCDGWVLANGDGIYYGEIMYYYGRPTPTRVVATPTVAPIEQQSLNGEGTPRIVITWIYKP